MKYPYRWMNRIATHGVLLLAIFFALAAVPKAFAEPTSIIVTETMQKLNSTDHMLMLNTTDEKITFDQILSGRYTSEFKPVEHISIHNLRGLQWLQGIVENPTDHDIEVYLQFDIFAHINFGLYTLDNKLLGKTQEAGWKTAFETHSLQFLQPTFEVVIPPGKSRIVMRNEGSVFTITAGSKAAIAKDSTDFEMCFLYFLATFISLGIYNIFIFSRTFDRAYLYYSLRCIVVAFVGGVTYNFVPKHFLPHIVYNHQTVSVSLAGLNSLIWLLVTRHFLSLDRFVNRKFLIGSMSFIALGLTTGCLYQLTHASSEPCILLRIFHPLTFLWMIGIGIFMCFKRYRPAYFYMPATTMYFVGVLTMILMVEGAISTRMFFYLAPSFGGTLEAIFMAFGLGDKYMMYMKAANAALNDRNVELDRELSHMLQALDQGIFSVTQNGKISPEHSNHLKVILDNDNLAGQDAFEMVFGTAEMSQDRKDQIKNTILLGIGEDEIFYELNSQILPREIVRHRGELEQTVEMDWQPLLNNEGKCYKLMVVMRDVSDLRDLKKDNEKNQRDLQIVGQILSISLPNYQKFSKSMTRIIQQNVGEISQYQTSGNLDLAHLFRNIHTIKGNARTFGLSFLADAAHEVENYLSELKQHINLKADANRLMEEVLHLEQVHDEYEDVITRLLNPSQTDSQSDILNALNVMHSEITNISIIKDKLYDLAESKRMERYFPTLEEMLAPIVRDQGRTAEELEKPMPRFIFKGEAVRMNVEMESFLRDIFTQILRNSVDHGIEAHQDRIAEGKDLKGTVTIFINAEVNTELLTIEVQDDGGGLNLEALAKYSNSPLSSDEEIGNAIFQTGVSTAKTVTQISGRGVGMDIVQDQIVKRGGTISIAFTAPKTATGRRPFKLVLTFPSRMALAHDSKDLKIAS